MKLEGGERLVLKTLKDLQGDPNDYVDDARLAAATKMAVDDVRDWLETLEGKGFVERVRLAEGFSAYITAKGRLVLRMTEPIPSPIQAGSTGESVSRSMPSGLDLRPNLTAYMASSRPLFEADEPMKFAVDIKLLNQSEKTVFVVEARLRSRSGRHRLDFEMVCKEEVPLLAGARRSGTLKVKNCVNDPFTYNLLRNVCQPDSVFEVVTTREERLILPATDVCDEQFLGWPLYIVDEETLDPSQGWSPGEPSPGLGDASGQSEGAVKAPARATSLESVASTRDDPARIEALVAQLQEYITEDRHQIRLANLIEKEKEAAYQASLGLHEERRQVTGTPESLAGWLARYDSTMRPLLSLVIHGCHWGGPQHIKLWVRCIDRMAGILGESLSLTPGLDLRPYPATLFLYGGGIASVAAGRYDTLKALLEDAEVRRWGKQSLPGALILHGAASPDPVTMTSSLDEFLGRLSGRERRYTPTSDHLNRILREPMKGIEPDDYKYDLLFDRFECLLAMTAGHLQFGPVKRHPSIAEARPSLPLLGIPMPAGRFGWRRNNHPDMLGSLKAEQSVAGANWPPLAAGMFGGDVQRFQGLVGSLESRVMENDWR